ncbi:hypothetical protein [Micromonospora globispora]|uniref:hypothetical protein n=1 Tax=Micromonospora globispora TaxID=1450148 RepID=UPI000F5DBAA5|nr:hypothetical protein [Micromonospora globispora]RQX07505.1 hypothetical protein DKL51_00880 [Micromonospora globispora]
MTLAIVLAADAASLPTGTGESRVDRLTGQWRRAGVADVRVAADLGELAALAAAATGPAPPPAAPAAGRPLPTPGTPRR